MNLSSASDEITKLSPFISGKRISLPVLLLNVNLISPCSYEKFSTVNDHLSVCHVSPLFKMAPSGVKGIGVGNGVAVGNGIVGVGITGVSVGGIELAVGRIAVAVATTG